jgi:hypothetical protein
MIGKWLRILVAGLFSSSLIDVSAAPKQGAKKYSSDPYRLDSLSAEKHEAFRQSYPDVPPFSGDLTVRPVWGHITHSQQGEYGCPIDRRLSYHETIYEWDLSDVTLNLINMTIEKYVNKPECREAYLILPRLIEKQYERHVDPASQELYEGILRQLLDNGRYLKGLQELNNIIYRVSLGVIQLKIKHEMLDLMNPWMRLRLRAFPVFRPNLTTCVETLYAYDILLKNNLLTSPTPDLLHKETQKTCFDLCRKDSSKSACEKVPEYYRDSAEWAEWFGQLKNRTISHFCSCPDDNYASLRKNRLAYIIFFTGPTLLLTFLHKCCLRTATVGRGGPLAVSISQGYFSQLTILMLLLAAAAYFLELNSIFEGKPSLQLRP